MTIDISNSRVSWLDNVIIDQHGAEVEQVFADHNKLTFVNPVMFLVWENIQVLDLSSNKLVYLPEYISNLSFLKYLNVDSNFLTSLPFTLLTIPQFKSSTEESPTFELHIQKNPFIDAELSTIASIFPYSSPKVITQIMPLLEKFKTNIEELDFTKHYEISLVDTIVNQKIRGCLYGVAIGDALGILTEYMDAQTAKKTYEDVYEPENGRFLKYSHRVTDKHREKWKQGDWTDITDHTILVLDNLCESGVTPFNIQDFSKRLERWGFKGYPELEDDSGKGVDEITLSVMRHQLFSTTPHMAAILVAGELGNASSTNASLCRNAITSCVLIWDEEKMLENVKRVCMTTHADPRCITACSIMSIIMRELFLTEEKKVLEQGWLDSKIEHALEKTASLLYDKNHATELADFLSYELLESFHLDNPVGSEYTFRCLGAGIWCLRKYISSLRELIDSVPEENQRALKGELFQLLVNELVMQGGSANSNASVASALICCFIGFDNIPLDLTEDFLHADWLTLKIDRFLNYLL